MTRQKVTDLSPAQWRIMATVSQRPAATISTVFLFAGADWPDLTDLYNRGLVDWTGEIPFLTPAGRSMHDVTMTRTGDVLRYLAGCRNGGQIREVRRLAFEWTLLTDAFRAGWLQIRNSESGEHTHRPGWEEALQFGGWDQSVMRMYLTHAGRPYAQTEA